MASPQSFGHVLYEVADRIATVTVNRPDKLNALNDAVMADIDRAFAHAKADALLLRNPEAK